MELCNLQVCRWNYRQLSLLGAFFLFLFMTIEGTLTANGSEEKVLFLAHRGQWREAIEEIQTFFPSDYVLIEKIALEALRQGIYGCDLSVQMLAVLGCGFSASEIAVPLLAKALQSRFPEVSYLAFQLLKKVESDVNDRLILQAAASDHPLIRIEAIHLLCQRKHPLAYGKAAALVDIMIQELKPLLVPLFAILNDSRSEAYLKRLLSDPDPRVRLATVQALRHEPSESLLHALRGQLLEGDPFVQEAVAAVLGEIRDLPSKKRLYQLTRHPQRATALAAMEALSKMGESDWSGKILREAVEGNLFAYSLIGASEKMKQFLIHKLSSKISEERLNAALQLFSQGEKSVSPLIQEIILTDCAEKILVRVTSSGGTFEYWKWNRWCSPSEDPLPAMASTSQQVELLRQLVVYDEEAFFTLSEKLFATDKEELIVAAIEELEKMGSKKAVEVLQLNQQKLGSSFVRLSCTLALHRLAIDGPYQSILEEWLLREGEIPFQGMTALQGRDFADLLTSKGRCRLYFATLEALAKSRSAKAIETILTSMRRSSPFDRSLLAASLLRAIE